MSEGYLKRGQRINRNGNLAEFAVHFLPPGRGDFVARSAAQIPCGVAVGNPEEVSRNPDDVTCRHCRTYLETGVVVTVRRHRVQPTPPDEKQPELFPRERTDER